MVGSACSSSGRNWICEHTNDPNYAVHSSKKDGDCFFSSVCNALEQPGIGVGALRKQLSGVASDETLALYRGYYENTRAIPSMRSMYAFVKPRNGPPIQDLAGLRAAMRKNSYWADYWAVVTAEELWNIKFIVHDKSTQGIYSVVSDHMRGKEPSFIMLAWDGSHYELVSHMGIRVFEDPVDLPKSLLERVHARCPAWSGDMLNFYAALVAHNVINT